MKCLCIIFLRPVFSYQIHNIKKKLTPALGDDGTDGATAVGIMPALDDDGASGATAVGVMPALDDDGASGATTGCVTLAL